MDKTYRKERIERLFYELKYELTRGVLEGEVDEQIGYRFVVPQSKTPGKDIVHAEFRMIPIKSSELENNRWPKLTY